MDAEVARSAKAALRRRQRALRAAVTEQNRQAASAAICRRLLVLPEVVAEGAVLGYAAVAGEVCVDPALTALLAAGREVFLPWVDGPELGVARIDDLEHDVGPGYRGVREPRDVTRHAPTDRFSVALVPGLAFDAEGGRLGSGGGHFDRLLARWPAHAAVVGVTYDALLVEEVPLQPHDRLVDVVVTEQRLWRPASATRCSPDRGDG